jgi:hypothetical protein
MIRIENIKVVFFDNFPDCLSRHNPFFIALIRGFRVFLFALFVFILVFFLL